MTKDEYTGLWLKKFFHKDAIPPVVKSSSTEVIDTVIQNNGSLGYIWSEESHEDARIKVLLTIHIED